MFGISLPELVVIGTIAILVIPAKEWPKVIRFGAKAYHTIQKKYYQILRELNLMDL
jgi:Sec-independent protein translocase protein TatA